MPPQMNNTPPFWTYSLPPPIIRPPVPAVSKVVETPSLPTQSQTTPSAVINSIDSGSRGPVPVYWSTPVVTSSTIQPASRADVNSFSQRRDTEVLTEGQTKSRGRSRKRWQYDSSSSDDESLERESSRWKGTDTETRDRSRSPQPPKMPVFTGKGGLSWEGFIYQFERTANRRDWEDKKKICRFLDCLSEVALEYARRAHTSTYAELRKYMKQRFSKKEEASAARRQLQFVKQQEQESLEEFAERVQFLTMDGFDSKSGDVIDQLGTEAFLRGCREKDAARLVIEKNPRTINEALKWVKSSMVNQRAIYGTKNPYAARSPFYAQRQVTFQEMSDSELQQQGPVAPRTSNQNSEKSLQSEVQNLVQLVGQLLKEGRNVGSMQSRNHQMQRPYARSPTPPSFRSREQSPYASRSPSPYRGQRSGSYRGKFENTPFRRAASPGSTQGTSSPQPSTPNQHLNGKGPGH